MEGIESQKITEYARLETKIKTEVEIKEEFYAAKETTTVDSLISKLSDVGSHSSNNTRFSSRCRLCATRENNLVDMFDPNNQDFNIPGMIQHCLPIAVKETDPLPKQVCPFCLKKLELCYEFHKTVAEAERQLLALDRLASGKLEEAARNCKTIPLCDGRRGPTERDSFGESLKTTSEAETSDDESITIPEQAKTADTTVKSKTVLKSMKPCSLVIFVTKTGCKDNLDAERGKKSSSDTKHRDPDLNTEALDSERTRASKIDRQSTCDSEAPTATCSRSIADVIKIFSLQSEKETEHQENLIIHERAPTRERRYRCHLCARMFETKRSLTRHNKLHTGEGLHSCKYCGKQFTDRTSRERHHLIHTNERRFKCSVCEKTFAYAQTLKRHAVVHSVERDYHCPLCDKSYKSLEMKRTHMVSHTGERLWKCDYCNNNFITKAYMRRHVEKCKERYRKR